MTLDRNYCANCGKEIPFKNPLLNLFMKQESSYNFKDGTYCETCARMKVEKERKKIK